VGKLAEALPYFRKACDLAREAAAAKPNDATAQDDLVRSEMAVDAVAWRAGESSQGETYFTQARKHAEEFLSAKPNDLAAKLLLADVLYMFGELHCFSGRLAESRAAMQDCLKSYEEAAKADPQNIYYQRNLSKAHYRLGNLDLLEQKPDDARPRFEEALKLRAALVSLSKDNDRRQMELMVAQAQAGQVDSAIATARRLEARPKIDPELRIDLARCYAAASRALPEAETTRRQTLQAAAMSALDAAMKDGYRDRVYLEGEPDYAPLRNRDDFKKLLQGLGGPLPVGK
jgi:tetratricopeptide (TPR) repeat protein